MHSEFVIMYNRPHTPSPPARKTVSMLPSQLVYVARSINSLIYLVRGARSASGNFANTASRTFRRVRASSCQLLRTYQSTTLNSSSSVGSAAYDVGGSAGIGCGVEVGCASGGAAVAGGFANGFNEGAVPFIIELVANGLYGDIIGLAANGWSGIMLPVCIGVMPSNMLGGAVYGLPPTPGNAPYALPAYWLGARGCSGANDDRRD